VSTCKPILAVAACTWLRPRVVRSVGHYHYQQQYRVVPGLKITQNVPPGYENFLPYLIRRPLARTEF